LDEKGGPRSGWGAALFGGTRRLAIEAVVIFGLIALTGFLVYHFTTHTIANKRVLGGKNVDVLPVEFNQSQMAFTFTRAGILWGASSDAGNEVLDWYRSADGGVDWSHGGGPTVANGCAQGAPQVATMPDNTQVLAFLAAPECGNLQSLTPFLVTSSRAAGATRWSKLTHVTTPEWKYGFDDGPALTIDGNRLYLAWERSLDKNTETTVVSTSDDDGHTWSAPVVVSRALDHPHLVTLAAAGGTLYVGGIDAKLGLWLSASHDDGRTFSPPKSIGQVLGNPAANCSQTAGQPLPREARACDGPNPALVADGSKLLLVYSDFGANRTSNVYAIGVDPSSLKPLFRGQVNPPDKGKTQQFSAVATVDRTTGTAWACWYDTTFDPHARRAWFTCAASHDGRQWSNPVAAASQPSAVADIYGTIGGYGLEPDVIASGGTAHAFWGDSRRFQDEIDVETASIPEKTAFSAPLAP
jgi:hypothetical protein